MKQLSLDELKNIITLWALESGHAFNVSRFNPTFKNFAGTKDDIHLALDFTMSLPENKIIILMSDHKDEWENLLSQEVDSPVHLYFYVKEFSEMKKDILNLGTILFNFKEHQEENKKSLDI